jgi:hypothetical protein
MGESHTTFQQTTFLVLAPSSLPWVDEKEEERRRKDNLYA